MWTCKVCNWTWNKPGTWPKDDRVRGQCGNHTGPGRKCPNVTPWSAEVRAAKEKESRARSESAGKGKEKEKLREKEKEKQKDKERGRSRSAGSDGPAIKKHDKMKRQASRSLARSDVGSAQGDDAKSDPYMFQAAPERHSERREQDAELKQEQEDEVDNEERRGLLLEDKKKAQRMLHQAKEEGYEASIKYWECYLTSINHQITELKPIKERKELFASRIADHEKDIERLKEEREEKIKDLDKKLEEKEVALARFKDLLAEVKLEEDAQVGDTDDGEIDGELVALTKLYRVIANKQSKLAHNKFNVSVDFLTQKAVDIEATIAKVDGPAKPSQDASSSVGPAETADVDPPTTPPELLAKAAEKDAALEAATAKILELATQLAESRRMYKSHSQSCDDQKKQASKHYVALQEDARSQMQKKEEQFQAMRDLEATQANVYSMRMSEAEQNVSEAAQEYAQLQQVVLEAGACSSSELQANLQRQFKARSDEVKAAQKAESQAQQQMQGVHTAEVAARQLQGALQRQQQELEFGCAELQTDQQMHTKHCEFQAEEMTARDVEGRQGAAGRMFDCAG